MEPSQSVLEPLRTDEESPCSGASTRARHWRTARSEAGKSISICSIRTPYFQHRWCGELVGGDKNGWSSSEQQASAVSCLAWICLLGAAFVLPDHRSAQQASPPGQDIVRLTIIDGRDIRFRRLSNTQNLTHVRVESIVQDVQGFMWFGTWNGLNRYDGYKFKVFKHEPGDPESLSGAYVCSLFKDHSGSLWVGTDGFVDRFDPETESFKHYKLDKSTANGLSSIVTNVSKDTSGNLLLSTHNGLFRLDRILTAAS